MPRWEVAGFGRSGRFPGIHHYDALGMLDRPRVDREPPRPSVVQKHPRWPAPPAPSCADLIWTDPVWRGWIRSAVLLMRSSTRRHPLRLLIIPLLDYPIGLSFHERTVIRRIRSFGSGIVQTELSSCWGPERAHGSPPWRRWRPTPRPCEPNVPRARRSHGSPSEGGLVLDA